MVGTLEERSAQYIAGYVVKKVTGGMRELLGSRLPEFARMSLRPGIGAGAIPDVASVMMQYKLERRLTDVPNQLRHGSRLLPLGRYLTKQLRKQVGLDEKCPEHVLEALRQGLLPVYESAKVVTSAPGMARFRRFAVQQLLDEQNKQAGQNAVAKTLIYNKRRTL